MDGFLNVAKHNHRITWQVYDQGFVTCLKKFARDDRTGPKLLCNDEYNVLVNGTTAQGLSSPNSPHPLLPRM